MKKNILILLSFLFMNTVFSQVEIDSVIMQSLPYLEKATRSNFEREGYNILVLHKGNYYIIDKYYDKARNPSSEVKTIYKLFGSESNGYSFSLETGGYTYNGIFSYKNEKIHNFQLTMIANPPLVNMPTRDSTKLCFQIGLSTHIINSDLKEYNYPFELLEDSLSNKVDLYYKTKKMNKKSRIFSTYSNMESFFQINCKQRKYYLMVFHNSAGYDFFILVQQYPFKLFKSEDYNFEQDRDYRFLDSSLNLKYKSIKIEFRNSSEIKTIQMREYGTVPFCSYSFSRVKIIYNTTACKS